MTSLVELEDLDEYLYQDETIFREMYDPQPVVFLLPGELHKATDDTLKVLYALDVGLRVDRLSGALVRVSCGDYAIVKAPLLSRILPRNRMGARDSPGFWTRNLPSRLVRQILAMRREVPGPRSHL